jgi:tRNA/rRNA methyltransferase
MPHPILILVTPQMGENIGACARAMHNFGLKELRIVNPRDGWPNPQAQSMAAGGVELIHRATLFPNLKEALHDIHYAVAATARLRDMEKPVHTPDSAAQALHARSSEQSTAIILGGERSGLSNEDVVLADAIVTIPVNPEYPSLNLAQSAVILCYEYYRLTVDNGEITANALSCPAPKEALLGFLEHLEDTLERTEFYRSPDMKETMKQNLRALFTRASLTEQEVRTLRGVIRHLEGKRVSE